MLNPELNHDALATAFRQKERLLIPDILDREAADKLSHCLREEVPWGLATQIDGAGRTFTQDELRAMAPEQWQQMVRDTQQEAQKGYQFFYNAYQIVTAYKEKRDIELFLRAFLEFLNSPAMIDFARRVTGHDDIAKADAQATRYLPGHFLRRHNDVALAGPTDSRRAAYVMNMTRNWQTDWGGLLHFMTEDGNIEESWVPGWNTLTLFNIPAWHHVSCVAPYATEPRLAVTGWFRTH